MLVTLCEEDKSTSVERQAKPSFRVIIVGRDALTAGTLADSLAHSLKIEAVAARQADLWRAIRSDKVDLAIIGADLDSKPGAGIDLAAAVSSAHPGVPMIILMDKPVSGMVVRAFLAGARGVFTAQDSISDFLDCVEHVRKGWIWAERAATDFLMEALKNIPVAGTLTRLDAQNLTTRELQVVELAVRGKTNKVIADEMHLSEHTVKNYLFKAFGKLGVNSRVELLFCLATRKHFLSDGDSALRDNPPGEELI